MVAITIRFGVTTVVNQMFLDVDTDADVKIAVIPAQQPDELLVADADLGIR
jgi:hypothetical protein